MVRRRSSNPPSLQTEAYPLLSPPAWNQVSNAPDFSTDGSTAASPAAAPASPQGQAVSSSLPLDYYVRFTLADGDAVTVNGGQLFALEGFSFSEQDSLSIGGQSGGAGAGKATFNPLQLTFSQLGLQPVLLQALATGSHFKEVDVLGYSQANQLVTDDSFGLVLASNLGVDSSGATQVSLEYGSQEIQQSTQLANGSLSPPVIASWNQVSNTADFSTDGSTAASPAAAPASPQGQAVSSSLPLDYYVRFTLADGDAVTVNGGQLFALEGFSFSEQDSLSIGGQSGGGAPARSPSILCSSLSRSSVCSRSCSRRWRRDRTSRKSMSWATAKPISSSRTTASASSWPAIWASISTGATQVSLEYGSQEIQSTQLDQLLPQPNFNGDNFSDLLWQNANGQASIWEMNGNTLIGGGAISPNPGPAWQAVGTGDFNGDGPSDILFQNTGSGEASIWDMNGDILTGGGPVTPNPGPSWKAIGTGDFNDDGYLRHPVSKREQRPSLGLGNEREHAIRRWTCEPQSRIELASSRVS